MRQYVCEAVEIDFRDLYFPSGWDVVYDRLGDGCKVVYPITMKSCIRWSRPCYRKLKLPDGSLHHKPRYFREVVHVTVR